VMTASPTQQHGHTGPLPPACQPHDLNVKQYSICVEKTNKSRVEAGSPDAIETIDPPVRRQHIQLSKTIYSK
jgi:hypothetical protein